MIMVKRQQRGTTMTIDHTNHEGRHGMAWHPHAYKPLLVGWFISCYDRDDKGQSWVRKRQVR